jgi:hypothetical protein
MYADRISASSTDLSISGIWILFSFLHSPNLMHSDQQTNTCMPDQSFQTCVNYDIQKHTKIALSLQNKCVPVVTHVPHVRAMVWSN